jgi:hypothetical protein
MFKAQLDRAIVEDDVVWLEDMAETETVGAGSAPKLYLVHVPETVSAEYCSLPYNEIFHPPESLLK